MYLRGGRGRPRAFTNGRRRLSLSRLFPWLCRVTLPAACAQVHPCTSLPFVLWALVHVVVVWSTSIFFNSSSCKRARLRLVAHHYRNKEKPRGEVLAVQEAKAAEEWEVHWALVESPVPQQLVQYDLPKVNAQGGTPSLWSARDHDGGPALPVCSAGVARGMAVTCITWPLTWIFTLCWGILCRAPYASRSWGPVAFAAITVYSPSSSPRSRKGSCSHDPKPPQVCHSAGLSLGPRTPCPGPSRRTMTQCRCRKSSGLCRVLSRARCICAGNGRPCHSCNILAHGPRYARALFPFHGCLTHGPYRREDLAAQFKQDLSSACSGQVAWRRPQSSLGAFLLPPGGMYPHPAFPRGKTCSRPLPRCRPPTRWPL
jgi:hypothetical protein